MDLVNYHECNYIDVLWRLKSDWPSFYNAQINMAIQNLSIEAFNDEEKQELIRAYSNNDKKRNEEIREKYNPDNIFKNKNKEKEVEQIAEEITAIVEYKKENFIQKLLNKIKRLFTR